MKLAIISDTHDELPYIEEFLDWANQNKIEIIIHCGDISMGGVLKFMANNFPGEINLVFGNMDMAYREAIINVCQKFPNLQLFYDQGELMIDEIKMAFCHFPKDAKRLAETSKYDFVFFGHTHKTSIETIDKCQLINPGTLGSVLNEATFITLNTKNKKLELINLNYKK